MTSAINGNTAASATSDQNAAAPKAGASPINKDMFLQLLVAQLRNQDPMHPSDGTQFVAQLAQFQQLEQSINSGQDIAQMRTDLDQLTAAYSAVSKT
jgi:flagellar basal-body rod modification protein FlgD